MILTILTLTFALVATVLPLMKLEYPALSGVVCASGANERWSVKILVPVLAAAALAVAGRVAPEWLDSFLYSPEELEVLYK